MLVPPGPPKPYQSQYDGALAPDLIEPFTGWRAWRTYREDQESPWRLMSVYYSTRWTPAERVESRCEAPKQSHMAPNRACKCGLYAAKEAYLLMDHVGGSVHVPMRAQMVKPARVFHDIRVFGSVKVWGKVIEGKGGYRALYAYPTKLWVIQKTGTRDLCDEIAWDLTEYRVPVGFIEGQERIRLRDLMEQIVSDHHP